MVMAIWGDIAAHVADGHGDMGGYRHSRSPMVAAIWRDITTTIRDPAVDT
jgi:hypothetical protein